MSSKIKLPRSRALRLARRLIDKYLDSVTERIEICGSLRRGKLMVNDIEIVAEPLIMEGSNLLKNALAQMEQRGIIKINKQGPKYCQFALLKKVKDGSLEQRLASIDLFIVTYPAQWGVIKLIRTGSARYSKSFATKLRDEGYCFHQGALWRKMPVDKEEEVYNHLAWEFVEPKDRE